MQQQPAAQPLGEALPLPELAAERVEAKPQEPASVLLAEPEEPPSAHPPNQFPPGR